MNLGIIFAGLTILLFGSWPVPTKTLNIEPKTQAFWLTFGHLLLSTIVFIFFAQPIPFKDFIGPFIAGILWGIGITLGYVGIKNLGITRALSIWIPIVTIVSALWWLIFFGEVSALGLEKLLLTSLAILLLITAALVVISSSKGEEKVRNVKVGILASIALGVTHGSFFVPLRTSSLPIFVTFLPLTIGMFGIVLLIIILQKVKIRYDVVSTARMILAGFLLGSGNYTALLTIKYLGVAQGYPLTQLGIIVNALWGTLVFKEVTTLRGRILVAIGIAIAIVGAVILNLARI